MPKKQLGIALRVKSEQSYLQKKVVDIDDYSVSAKTERADGAAREVCIHVDATSVIEEDPSNSSILRSQELGSMTYTKVKRRAGKLDVLKLCFSQGPNLRYPLQPHELDYFLSNILASILTKEGADSIPVLLRAGSRGRLKVWAIPADSDFAYESSLNGALCEACYGCAAKELLTPGFESLLVEAAFNLKPKDYDFKLVSALFSALGELAQTIRSLETSTDAMKDYLSCLDAADKTDSDELSAGIIFE